MSSRMTRGMGSATTTAEVRLGLVGCGAAARKYHLPGLKSCRRLLGDIHVVDKDLARAAKAATEIGDACYSNDYKHLIGKVNGVILAVPHQLHCPLALDFLRAGIHVLCEKPLAESECHAREMVEQARSSGVHLCVNKTRRLFPCFQKIKNLIQAHVLGPLVSIRYYEAAKFSWESETAFYVDPKASSKGVLLDIGSHVLDLIVWWLGTRPVVEASEDDSFGGPESLVRVKARLGPCSIEVVLNRLIDADGLVVVTGRDGSVECNLGDWKTVSVRMGKGPAKRLRQRFPYRAYGDMVHSVLRNFLQVVGGNAAPLIPGSEVIDSIAMIEECYRQRSRFSMPWYENLGSLFNPG